MEINLDNKDNIIEKKSRKKKISIETNLNDIINSQHNEQQNNKLDNSINQNKNDKIIKIDQEENNMKPKRGKKKVN